MFPHILYAVSVDGQYHAGTVWKVSNISVLESPSVFERFRGRIDPELELLGYTTTEIEFFARRPSAPILRRVGNAYEFNAQSERRLINPTRGKPDMYEGPWTFGWLKFAVSAQVVSELARVGIMCKWAASRETIPDPTIDPYDRITEY
jgi:hypothetical protein